MSRAPAGTRNAHAGARARVPLNLFVCITLSKIGDMHYSTVFGINCVWLLLGLVALRDGPARRVAVETDVAGQRGERERGHAGQGGQHQAVLDNFGEAIVSGAKLLAPGADGSSEDLSALGKREKVKDKVKRYIAKLSFVEMSVMKATTKIDGPPKEKHTRRLVLESWSHPDTAPAEVVHALSRCNLVNNVTVSLKALSTVHELMQRGSPAVLPAVYGWLDHMSLVQNHWDRNGKNADYGLSEVCSPLVVAYARLLTAKARFHAEHRAFENNYSFDGEAGAGVGGGGPHPISAAIAPLMAIFPTSDSIDG